MHTRHQSRIARGLTAAVTTTAVIAATAGAAAIGGAPGSSAAAADAERRAPSDLTRLGFRADAYGVKLVTDSVEALSVKDAHAQQLCTRSVGVTDTASSALSTPDNPLINVSASTSRTHTYREGSTKGVRATNTIGDVSIGGTVGPLTTPRLVIEGLESTADAFRAPQGYGHEETFDFASLRLELLDNTVVDNLPPELQQLLEPLDQVTGTVFEGTEQVADEVFAVLQDATRPIAIPGLGTIALGRVGGRAGGRQAHSTVSALRIEVTAGDRRQLVELGTARARVGGPAQVAAFRAGGTAMDYQVLDGALRFGNVQRKSLPCEGSRGKRRTYRIGGASQLLPVPTVLSGVTYAMKGDQRRRGRVAKGWASTRIASVSIPTARLEITDVFARTTMRRKKTRRVISRPHTSVGSITVGGEPLAVPRPGRSVELPDGSGVIQRQVVRRGFRGAKVIGLRVKLYDEAVVIDLAHATGHLFPR